MLNGYRLLECDPLPDYASIEHPPEDLLDGYSELVFREAEHIANASRVPSPRREFAETMLFTKGPYGSKGSFEAQPAASSLLLCPEHLDAAKVLVTSHGSDPDRFDAYLKQSADQDVCSSMTDFALAMNGKYIKKLPLSTVGHSLERDGMRERYMEDARQDVTLLSNRDRSLHAANIGDHVLWCCTEPQNSRLRAMVDRYSKKHVRTTIERMA